MWRDFTWTRYSQQRRVRSRRVISWGKRQSNYMLDDGPVQAETDASSFFDAWLSFRDVLTLS